MSLVTRDIPGLQHIDILISIHIDYTRKFYVLRSLAGRTAAKSRRL